MGIIRNLPELDAALDNAASHDGRLRDALRAVRRVPLRKRGQGFQTLLYAIVGQQISVNAAAAIWQRLKEAGLTRILTVRSASDEQLASCGLSRPKIRYARELAAARIDYRTLRQLSTEEIVERLTRVPGIGRWTAEIYALFALGQADAFPAGDLALQESVRLLYELPTRPTEKELRTFSERWSPHRGAVARLLWEYYALRKKGL